MFQEDSLQILPDSEIPELLASLKPLIPNSIHAYYFIDCIVKMKKKLAISNEKSEMECSILTPKGGSKTGAVFFYLCGFNHMVCSAYVWTKEGKETLPKALLTTERFQWTKYKNILISSLTQEVLSIIEPVMPKIMEGREHYQRLSYDKVFWFTAEEASKFDIEVPEGMVLGDLKEEHAETIDSVWPHRAEGTKDLIALMTKVNFGKGLFKPDGKLVAWAFYWFFGALGVVQTAEDEKRKGYGKVVVKAVCKEMGSRGLDVHLNIVGGNTVSEAFFESLGVKFAFDSIWAAAFPQEEKKTCK